MPPAGGAGQGAAETAAIEIVVLLAAAVLCGIFFLWFLPSYGQATLQYGMRLPPQGSTRQCKG